MADKTDAAAGVETGEREGQQTERRRTDKTTKQKNVIPSSKDKHRPLLLASSAAGMDAATESRTDYTALHCLHCICTHMATCMNWSTKLWLAVYSLQVALLHRGPACCASKKKPPGGSFFKSASGRNAAISALQAKLKINDGQWLSLMLNTGAPYFPSASHRQPLYAGRISSFRLSQFPLKHVLP